MRSVTRSGQKSGQMQQELDAFIAALVQANVRSYLEVGARYGDTFYDVMRALPIGSQGVCVDLPGHVWGTAGSLSSLRDACEALRSIGQHIVMLTGDSTDPAVIAEVAKHGPFDAALIDGDHRYQGVKADFTNYSPLCRLVALHDIVGVGQRHSAGIDVEVPRFWQEIRHPGCQEFIAPGSTMGIGLWHT